MKCLLLVSLFIFSITRSYARNLEFSISETTSAPLFFSSELRKSTKGKAGILYDVNEAIAQELHMKANITPNPRGRIAMMLLYGETDAYCYSRPDWLEHSSELRWSVPLFNDRNLIVTRKDTPPVKDLKDLNGKTIATVLGFLYPELGDPFANASIIRSDSVDVGTTMTKLELKRVDYALMDELYFKYYIKNHPKSDLNEVPFVIRSFDVYCTISPKAPFSPKDFDSAIEKLTANKTIQKIIEKYQ